MADRWRRYAVWGLCLAIVGLLAAIGLSVVQRAWVQSFLLSLGTAAALLALFILLAPRQLRAYITGRQARRGRKALLSTALLLGVLGLANYLGYENAPRWDVTADKVHSLSPETIETLKALPAPVTALAFYSGNPASVQAHDLLADLDFYSDGSFIYEFINPDEDPVSVKKYDISRDGTIVLLMGEVHEQVTYADERELVGALIRLISPEGRKVYFLTGHGEHDPEGVGDQAYAYARRALVTKNYMVDQLNLFADPQIPDDASVVIVAGPAKPLSASEVEILGNYLQNGGSLVVLEEPLPMTSYGGEPDPLAAYLEEVWGIHLGEDLVVDLTSNQPLTAVANEYGTHAITQKMQGLVTFFPEARSVQIIRRIDGHSYLELVMTATQSWAERDLAAIKNDLEIAPDNGVDLLGPVTLAVVAENSATRARLVVFGDSDFASDSRFKAYGNGELFVNALDWAAEQDELIRLTPRQQTQRILIPLRRAVFNVIVLLLVFILPGTVILVGGFSWYQRRRYDLLGGSQSRIQD